MSFLHSDESESTPGIRKLLVLAIVILIAIGGALWFLNRSSEPVPEPEVVDAPPTVIEDEPPPPPPPPKARKADLPAFGSLVVTANVDAASVYVDGELVGSHPPPRYG